MNVFGIIFPVFAIVAIGFLYGRRHGPDMASANRVNLDVFTPALILSVFGDKYFALDQYAGLAVAGILVILGSGALAWPVAHLMKWNPKTLVPPMMFSNSGNMGLPLALFAFGKPGLAAAMVLFVVERTLHFTLGAVLLSGRLHLITLLRNPLVIAILAGLLLNASAITLPTPVHQTIQLLGQASIPLMLFALGVRLTDVGIEEWKIALTGAVLCPVSGIIMAWIAIQILGLSVENRPLLYVFGVLPPAVLNYMYAEQFNVEPHKVATIVMIGNALSVITIPMVLYAVLP